MSRRSDTDLKVRVKTQVRVARNTSMQNEIISEGHNLENILVINL